ncbi:SMI1/KNR4 family protein [Chromobacterium sp. ASV23]|uniref:SMI1/KNR4 family protein n=1 Tax=Chromobacterium sp. ASV23 TaxID=2795110 RepID=UPI0018ECB967|nr:SMI1/KNR4 family protein [Chromobacterium sp. ASV23]
MAERPFGASALPTTRKMGLYDDLLSRKGTGTPFDKLAQLPAEQAPILSPKLALPQDYISFLLEIGSGELGAAAYMLYASLVEPEEIYGEAHEGLDSIFIFGDDFQGFNTGFRVNDWSVVEIDPSNMTTHVLAPSFQVFIRRKIAELI